MLVTIRRSKHITLQQLADKAHIPLSTVYVMEIGGHVSKADAESVLQAFSELTEHTYTFQNVQVNIKHVEEEVKS